MTTWKGGLTIVEVSFTCQSFEKSLRITVSDDDFDQFNINHRMLKNQAKY